MVLSYGKTVLAMSANMTARVSIYLQFPWKSKITITNIQQAASWGAQNPVLATCAVVGTTSTIIIASPGLVTVPVLSGMGFTAGGIKAGMCEYQEGFIVVVFPSSRCSNDYLLTQYRFDGRSGS